MNYVDHQYLNLCEDILEDGEERTDRTGTGTLSLFDYRMTYDLRKGFPLLTTKDMTKSFEHVVAEMLWMLKGSTNANELADMGFGIWRKWAKDDSGDLGPVYGHQWRNFNGEPHSNEWFLKGVDQISWVINEIKTKPDSRRMVVSAWNPNQLDDMALPPCHWAFELYVNFSDNTLNMKLHQRSCDVFLGVPYNIAEYALLLTMISYVTGYEPGLLVHDMTNVHIYKDHVEQVKEQLERIPYELPALVIRDRNQDIFSWTREDFKLIQYRHHPALTGKVSV
jgi:thymidylate synthase